MFVQVTKRFNERLFSEYKIYRNLLNRLIQLAKQNYFKQYVQTNKGNSDKIWKAIKELTN